MVAPTNNTKTPPPSQPRRTYPWRSAKNKNRLSNSDLDEIVTAQPTSSQGSSDENTVVTKVPTRADDKKKQKKDTMVVLTDHRHKQSKGFSISKVWCCLSKRT